MKQIKNFLKRILPVSYACFYREIEKQNELQEQLLKELQTVKYAQLELLPDWINTLKMDLNVEQELMKKHISVSLMQNLSIQSQQAESIFEKIAALEARLNTLTEQRNLLAQVDKKVDKLDELFNIKLLTETVKRNVDEVIFAEIFNNMIQSSTWLKDTAFMPGRWAVGYQYLYAMYRILDEFKPQSILEMGLGQSTKLISQYAGCKSDVSHYVVENSKEWIDFYSNSNVLPVQTKIKYLPIKMETFADTEVRVYEGFEECFKNMTFDCISIDAPLGGDMKKYARIDILSIIPKCLAKQFVIVVDDYNREQEKNMVKLLEEKLHKSNIQYKKGIYSGSKDVLIITSIDNAYLCTM